jgi:hypothetical protein
MIMKLKKIRGQDPRGCIASEKNVLENYYLFEYRMVVKGKADFMQDKNHDHRPT